MSAEPDTSTVEQNKGNDNSGFELRAGRGEMHFILKVTKEDVRSVKLAEYKSAKAT